MHGPWWHGELLFISSKTIPKKRNILLFGDNNFTFEENSKITYHIKNLRQSDAHIDSHIFGMIKNWSNMSIIIRHQIFQKSRFMLSTEVSLW